MILNIKSTAHLCSIITNINYNIISDLNQNFTNNTLV